MTDKFDILIFIKGKLPGHATWSDMLKFFVEEAPPYRRISKRTLHLALLELIEDGYVEKIIDKKTLGPVYVITKSGIIVAHKKEVEREWIEAVKQATEKTLIKYIESHEELLNYREKEVSLLHDAYNKILMDIFGMTPEECDVLYKIYMFTREGEEGTSYYEGFYFWLKEQKYLQLKYEDYLNPAKHKAAALKGFLTFSSSLTDTWNTLQEYIKKRKTQPQK